VVLGNEKVLAALPWVTNEQQSQGMRDAAAALQDEHDQVAATSWWVGTPEQVDQQTQALLTETRNPATAPDVAVSDSRRAADRLWHLSIVGGASLVPAQRDAARTAGAGSYDQIKHFLVTQAYPGKTDDDRIAVQKILNTGGPATRAAANAALNGTPDDVAKFLATGRQAAADALAAGKAAADAAAAANDAWNIAYAKRDNNAAQQAVTSMQNALQTLRDQAAAAVANHPELQPLVDTLNQVLSTMATMAHATAGLHPRPRRRAVGAVAAHDRVGGGLGLALSGVGMISGGLAACGVDVTSGMMIGGTATIETGPGAIAGAAAGGIGGLLVCVFAGGGAITGGIAAILNGLTMAMSGIEGAADDVSKLAKKKGSLEGRENVNVFRNPQKSQRITDFDYVEDGVLWENKTAVSTRNRKI
jgi:hypothetical protein